MKANGILRVVCLVFATLLSLSLAGHALAQDVGSDVGGGAGIFRAKNPETKKKGTTKPTATRPGTHTPPAHSNASERIEELLDKGNTARDSRDFGGAEDAYKQVLKLAPRDARA